MSQVLAVLMGLALGGYPSGAQQARLNDAITMSEVQAILGPPDRVDQATCGAKSGEPWTCRKWVYETDGNPRTFTVFFQETRRGWLVNSWSSL